MRKNLPVTQKEYPFPPGQTLVSTTDPQGRIIYCNAAFVTVSGFEHAELLGQPHNMIRHPDMPEEAFRDMWATIQGGLPWSAAVKNRRKDGSHYWVMANVTPIMDPNGNATGFMSVRTEASRAEITAADALYARMREEASSGQQRLRLHRSALVDSGLGGRVKQALSVGLRGQTAAICFSVGAVGWGLGSVASTSALAAVAGGLTLLTAAALATWGLNRLTLRPLEALVGYANRMAGCDLTQSFSSTRTDTVGHLTRALAQLNVNLLSVVRDARDGMLQIRNDTRAIADGNQDLSSRTESQASNLEETASSMEEITSTIRQSTDMAVQAANQAGNALEVTQRSGAAVDALGSTMHNISEASRKISEIIQVVDSIAFQTNILALNAAVEAARAGEQGRGFAVVAGEVRALAQRTTVAAREIRGLIQASVEQVAEGGEQTRSASAAMGEARRAVEQVHEFIQQISLGMKEQMLGVSQVNQAVAEMDTMTQKNAALVEEVAASASTLNDKTSQVADSVGVFRLAGDGSKMADAVDLRKRAKAAQKAESAPAGTPALNVGGANAMGNRTGSTSSGFSPSAASRSQKQAPVSATAPKLRPAASKPAAARPEPAMAEASADGDWDTF